MAFTTALATCAAAQDKPPGYPAKPIRIIIGIAPAGGLDAMARLGAQKLTERWSQTVIVDNRPGGGTALAMEMVPQAAPDGYTLLGASETLMKNGVLKRTPYDVRKMFIPVVQLTTQPYVLVVHSSVPAKNVKELVALAKAKPGALTYGYVAPAGTPMNIVRAIAGVVSQGMNTPDTVKMIAAEGSDVVAPATPEEFRGKFEREYAELEKQIRVYKNQPPRAKSAGYVLETHHSHETPNMIPVASHGELQVKSNDLLSEGRCSPKRRQFLECFKGFHA